MDTIMIRNWTIVINVIVSLVIATPATVLSAFNVAIVLSSKVAYAFPVIHIVKIARPVLL